MAGRRKNVLDVREMVRGNRKSKRAFFDAPIIGDPVKWTGPDLLC